MDPLCFLDIVGLQVPHTSVRKIKAFVFGEITMSDKRVIYKKP